MDAKQIVVTQYDLDRLRRIVNDAIAAGTRDDLAGLIGELERARVVEPSEIPPDTVTMNSKVRLVDALTAETLEMTLVFPENADSANGCISVLAPVGTAIIGYSEGDSIDWPTPGGTRTFTIEKVLFQPEAAGDWEL